MQDTESKKAIKDALSGSQDRMFDKIRVPELPRIRKEVCTPNSTRINVLFHTLETINDFINLKGCHKKTNKHNSRVK